jgi:hypothetical protein
VLLTGLDRTCVRILMSHYVYEPWPYCLYKYSFVCRFYTISRTSTHLIYYHQISKMATVRIKNSYLGDRKPQGIEKNLFELFEEYLQPLSTTSPGTAAQKVNDLFPDHRSEVMEGKLVKESPEGFLWELWCQLFDIAGQLPRDSPCQERLAELVKALSTIRTSTTVEIRGSNITLWESLPSLTLCAREELNCEF